VLIILVATTDDTDDVHLRRPHQRCGVVDVVFVSLQRHNNDDVVNASSSRRCTLSKRSHRRRSRQRHRHDDVASLLDGYWAIVYWTLVSKK